MEIAIVGTGNIGATLARHWAGAGHHIHLGTRDVQDGAARALADEVSASLSSPAEAAGRSEVVALAIPGNALAETVGALASELGAKTIVVPANRMGEEKVDLAREVAGLVPEAGVIRAFNTLPFELIAAGALDGEQLDMLYAASDQADAVAVELISACGLRPIRVGGIDQARLLDDLFALWAAVAFGAGRGRGIAFALRGV